MALALMVGAAILGPAQDSAARGNDGAQDGGQSGARVLIIAHRGASGERPEHTLAAYERAIDLGADFIEPDLVATADGVLVARHENEISQSTDVASRPEFAASRRTRTIDGQEISGWFTEDFTLAQLRTLRARERVPALRPANTGYDGLYLVPTLGEIIALVKAKEAETGRRIGIYPEIKHPAYFASIGHDLPALLVKTLHEAGYRSASDPVFIQSFEVDALVRLSTMTPVRLIQLVASAHGPADRPGQSYAGMLGPEGLAKIARYASGIGADLGLILQPDGRPGPLAAAAKAAGLDVHAWTLRRENAFLPEAMRRGGGPAAAGDYAGLWALLVGAGVDGVFTDHVAEAVAARASH